VPSLKPLVTTIKSWSPSNNGATASSTDEATNRFEVSSDISSFFIIFLLISEIIQQQLREVTEAVAFLGVGERMDLLSLRAIGT